MNGETPGPLSGPVVVDASCAVEYLVELTLSDAATRLFHSAARGTVELWAPDLLYSESVSALRKLVRRGLLGEAPGERAVDQLVQLPISIAGSAALMQPAWGMRAFLTPYDACYVALSDALESPFVTGERALAVELLKRGKRARYLGDL